MSTPAKKRASGVALSSATATGMQVSRTASAFSQQDFAQPSVRRLTLQTRTSTGGNFARAPPSPTPSENGPGTGELFALPTVPNFAPDEASHTTSSKVRQTPSKRNSLVPESGLGAPGGTTTSSFANNRRRHTLANAASAVAALPKSIAQTPRHSNVRPSTAVPSTPAQQVPSTPSTAVLQTPSATVAQTPSLTRQQSTYSVTDTPSNHYAASAAGGSALSSVSDDRIKVVARLRCIAPEEPRSATCDMATLVHVDSDDTIRGQQRQTFAYDYVFGEATRQRDVFDVVGKDSTEQVMNGFNATIMAYGQTSSGKTYTMRGLTSMTGSPEEDETAGLVSRCVSYLFQRMDEVSKAESGVTFSLTCSYLEIYCETVYDLLAREDNTALTVRCRTNPVSGSKSSNANSAAFYAEGLTEVQVSNLDELGAAIRCGDARRRVAATLQNERSSRSHAILTLTVRKSVPSVIEGEEPLVYVSKLNLVDLAGSEKLNVDKALESKKINLSLTILSKVMHGLSQGASHVGFRESELTKLLADSLSGSAKTTLIACINPDAKNRVETLSTLRFASNAKTIPVHAKQWALDAAMSKRERDEADLRELREVHRRAEAIRELLDKHYAPQVDSLLQKIKDSVFFRKVTPGQAHMKLLQLSETLKSSEGNPGSMSALVQEYARPIARKLDLSDAINEDWKSGSDSSSNEDEPVKGVNSNRNPLAPIARTDSNPNLLSPKCALQFPSLSSSDDKSFLGAPSLLDDVENRSGPANHSEFETSILKEKGSSPLAKGADGFQSLDVHTRVVASPACVAPQSPVRVMSPTRRRQPMASPFSPAGGLWGGAKLKFADGASDELMSTKIDPNEEPSEVYSRSAGATASQPRGLMSPTTVGRMLDTVGSEHAVVGALSKMQILIHFMEQFVKYVDQVPTSPIRQRSATPNSNLLSPPINKQIENLQDQVVRLRTELSQAQAELATGRDTWEKEKRELEARMATLAKSNEDAAAAYAALQVETETQLQMWRNDMDILRQEKEALSLVNSEIRQQLDECHHDNASQREEIGKYQCKLAEVMGELNSTKAQLQSEVELRQRIQVELTEANDRYRSLMADHDDIANQKSLCESRCSSLEKDVEVLRSDVARAAEELSRTRASEQLLSEQATAAKITIDAKDKELDELRAKLHEAEKDGEGTRTLLDSCQREHDALRESFDRAQAKLTQLESHISELTQLNDQLKEASIQKSESIADLQQELASVKQAKEADECTISAMSQEISDKSARLQELSQMVEARSREYQEALSKRDSQIESLKAQLDSKSVELSSLTAALQERDAIATALNEQIKMKDDIINNLEDRIKKSNETVESLQQEVVSGAARAQEQQRSMAEMQANYETEVDNLRTQLQNEQEIKESLTAQLETSKGTIESLQQKIAANEILAAQQQQSMIDMQQSFATEVSQLREQLQDEQAQKVGLASQIATSKEVIETLQQKLAAADGRAEEQQRLLEEIRVSHEFEISALREQLQTGQTTNNNLMSQLEESSKTIQSLQQKIAAADSSAQEQLRVMAEMRASLQDEISNLRGQLQSEHVAKSELASQLEKVRDVIEALQQKVADTNSIVAMQRQSIEEMQVSHDVEVKGLRDQLQAEHVAKDQLSSELEKSMARQEAYGAEVAALTERLAGKEKELNEASARIQALQQTSAGLQSQLDKVLADSAEAQHGFEGELHNATQRITELEASLQLSQDGAAKLQAQLEEKVANISHLEESLAACNQEIAEKGRYMQEQTASMTAQAQSLKELESEIVLYKDLTQAHLAELAECKERIETLEQKCSAQQDENTKLLASNQNLILDCQQKGSDISALQASVMELMTKLEKAKGEIQQQKKRAAEQDAKFSDNCQMLQALEAKVSDMQSALDAKSKHLHEVRQALEAKTAELEEQKCLAHEQQSVISQHVSELELRASKLQALEEQVTRLTQRIDSLEAEKSELCTTIEQLQHTVEERDKQIHELACQMEEQHSKLANECEELLCAVASRDKDLADYAAKFIEIQDQLDAERSSRQALETRISDNAAKLQASEQRADEYSSELQKLKAENSAKQRALEAALSDCQAYADAHAALQSRCAVLEQNWKDAVKSKEDLERVLEEAHGQTEQIAALEKARRAEAEQTQAKLMQALMRAERAEADRAAQAKLLEESNQQNELLRTDLANLRHDFHALAASYEELKNKKFYAPAKAMARAYHGLAPGESIESDDESQLDLSRLTNALNASTCTGIGTMFNVIKECDFSFTASPVRSKKLLSQDDIEPVAMRASGQFVPPPDVVTPTCPEIDVDSMLDDPSLDVVGLDADIAIAHGNAEPSTRRSSRFIQRLSHADNRRSNAVARRASRLPTIPQTPSTPAAIPAPSFIANEDKKFASVIGQLARMPQVIEEKDPSALHSAKQGNGISKHLFAEDAGVASSIIAGSQPPASHTRVLAQQSPSVHLAPRRKSLFRSSALPSQAENLQASVQRSARETALNLGRLSARNLASEVGDDAPASLTTLANPSQGRIAKS